jgi:hypothetical protein
VSCEGFASGIEVAKLSEKGPTNMEKQRATKEIAAVMLALEALERALKNDDEHTVIAELWNARRHLLSLSIMIDKEKDNGNG